MSDDNYAPGQWVRDDYQWAPDLGLYIAYRANEDDDNLVELYYGAQNGQGTKGLKINESDENIEEGFKWAPGGLLPGFTYDYIAYRSSSNVLKMRQFLGVADPEIVIMNNVGDNDFFDWAPLFKGSDDDNRANWEVTTTTYIAFISGGTLYTRSALDVVNVEVSGLDPDEDAVDSAQWSLDARHLVYRDEDTLNHPAALYATPADQQQGEMIF